MPSRPIPQACRKMAPSPVIASLSCMPSCITLLLRESSLQRRFLRSSRGSGRTFCPPYLDRVIGDQDRLGLLLARATGPQATASPSITALSTGNAATASLMRVKAFVVSCSGRQADLLAVFPGDHAIGSNLISCCQRGQRAKASLQAAVAELVERRDCGCLLVRQGAATFRQGLAIPSCLPAGRRVRPWRSIAPQRHGTRRVYP